ncbi:TRAP transporter substrate-binding protein DctP [Chloroflexota bacterium]
MRKKVKLVYLGLAICLIASMLIFGCAGPAPTPSPAPTPTPTPAPTPTPKPTPEKVVITAVSMAKSDYPTNRPMWLWLEILEKRVAEQYPGELEIDYLGGPEVINLVKQPTACIEGVFDMNLVTTLGFYRKLIPGGLTMICSQLWPWEERERGFNDYMNELHAKAGLYWLGRGSFSAPGENFWWFTTEKVNTPYDLAGQRVGPATIAFNGIQGVGASPTRMSFPDTYSAVERGVIDAVVSPLTTPLSYSWQEVLPYGLAQPFLQCNTVNIMNLDKWNSIPKHLQDLMIETKIESEKQWAEKARAVDGEEVKELEDAGMEFIKFSPADAKWFTDTTRMAEWEAQLGQYPVEAARFKDILER